ncbi:hypothetical protein AX17_005896 [Amanita inopinata Kibby_2008]|nr:hypothetical protein AX17_005896 [Amanita inopinata Kibby_2008]
MHPHHHSADACPACGYPNNILKTIMPEPLDLPCINSDDDFFPSQPMKSTIQQSIADGEAKVASVTEEIRHFNFILQQLYERKKELKEDIAYKRALISPIRRLPAELLGQIFLECVPPGELDRKNSSMSPFVLSQVCRQWRAVSHSMQLLWSTFVIHCGWSKVSSTAESRFQSFIDRSGQQPLSFRFFSFLEERKANSHPILSRLFELSARWRKVSLCMPYKAFSEDRYKDPIPLPELESLVLENPHIALGGLPESMRSAKTFSVAPRLRHLSLEKYLLPTRVFAFPWSQITHLQLKENLIEGNDYANILREATNLVSLVAENNHFIQSLNTTIVSHSIKSLTVIVKTSLGGIQPFLAPLILPNLTTLSLRFWKPPQVDINAAVRFLERSACPITDFSCHSLDDAQLVRLIEKMPHVVRADLQGSLIRPSLIKRLKYDPNADDQDQDDTVSAHVESEASTMSTSISPRPPCLFPKLETLLLSDTSLVPDLAGLTEVISSRIKVVQGCEDESVAPPIAALKKVKVTLRKEVEPAALRKLKEFSQSELGKYVVAGLNDRGVAVYSP